MIHPPLENPPEQGLITIRFEQAVYGSFAFRPDGYAMLASSPGCRPQWLADFRTACQRIGEQPAGVPDRTSLFATRLSTGPWCIVGVFPQGSDDRGRPGALAFHGLFLSGRDYRTLGASPFPLTTALRGQWSESQTLDSGLGAFVPEPPGIPGHHHEPADRIAKALRLGWKAGVESPEPGDELARDVWQRLPLRFRKRLSLATWAFGNGNGFDLFIGPKLAGVAFDSRTIQIELDAPSAQESALRSRSLFQAHRVIALGVLAAGLALTVFAVWLSLQLRETADEPSRPAAVSPKAALKPVSTRAEPSPAISVDEEISPDERERLVEALVHMNDRFGLSEGDPLPQDGRSDPSALMNHLASRLRYDGPFLSESDREALRNDSRREAGLALRWEDHIHKFAADRPLPADFASKGISSQVALLVWSFHLDSDHRATNTRARLSPAERVQALAEELTVDMALRPTPLVEQYPALASYLTFLGRLPRR